LILFNIKQVARVLRGKQVLEEKFTIHNKKDWSFLKIQEKNIIRLLKKRAFQHATREKLLKMCYLFSRRYQNS
jgi:hypothetical protein